MVTILICVWLLAIAEGDCIATCLSDISGAFDRVFTPYLLYKLQHMGVGPFYLKFLASWCSQRIGKVCVQGHVSDPVLLINQVFQGTVLGPPLWNGFFADIISEAVKHRCSGKAFADDFNIFRAFDRNTPDRNIYRALDRCKADVHTWGERNRVAFDATKEAYVILHPFRGLGDTFKLLGLLIDNGLRM